MDNKDKHKVPLNLHSLHETALFPPRKKLWDYVPEWLGMWLIRRGFNPKPTPYELWLIHSVALRAYYSRFHRAINLLNQQSLEMYDVPEPRDLSELN